MSKIETARRTYIRLLLESAAKPDTMPPERRDMVLRAELITGEFLSGSIVQDHSGSSVHSASDGITPEGRLLLQRLLAEERADSLVGRSLQYAPLLIGYIAGLLSPIISDLIRSLMAR